MMSRQERAAYLLLFWMLICGLNAVVASTRRRPFARPRNQEARLDDSQNETVKEESKEDAIEYERLSSSDGVIVTETKPPKQQRSFLSDWFERLNQKSIDNEEQLRQNKDETKRSSETSASNKTASEGPKGRYWPASSESKSRIRPSKSDKDLLPPPVNDKDESSEAPGASTEGVSPAKSKTPTLFHDLRNMFRPKEPEIQHAADSSKEETTKQLVREIEPDQAVSDTDSNMGPSNSTSLLSKLEESATNVQAFLRQLPWTRQQVHDSNRTMQSDVRNDISAVALLEVDTNETLTLAEVPESLPNDEAMSLEPPAKNPAGARPILSKLKESASNTTAFLHQKVEERNKTRPEWQQGNGTRTHEAKNTTNPIAVIRNLPWTPQAGKKYSETISPEPPIKVNPIQFLRGLPWRPQPNSHQHQIPKTHEKKTQQATPPVEEEILVESSSDEERQGSNEKRDAFPDVTSSHVVQAIDKDNEKESQAGTGRREEVSINEAKTSIGDSTQPTLTESVTDDGEDDGVAEEGGIMAAEVNDVLSKYLLRQERETSSSDDDDIEDVSSAGMPTSTGNVTVGDTNSVAADQAPSVESENPNVKDKDSRVVSTLSLDSMIRRILGSTEEQYQKVLESKDKTNETSPLNTTSPTKSKGEPEFTEDIGPAPNRTLPPVEEGQQRRDGQRDQQPPQQQPTVIIMGGGPHDARSLPSDLSRRPVPTPSLVLIEALATILGTAIRIWMISFLAKWWSEEETLRPVQHFVYERLNDKYNRDATVLQNVLEMPPTGISEWKWRRYLRRQHRVEGKIPRKQVPSPATFARTVLVLSIDSDMSISHLENAVSFILSQHREQAFGSIGGLAKELEVIIVVDSPGGAVQDFGLAGAQVRRFAQEAGITTTACVDHIAASGGYMIASQADRIFASTFAIVGSIGVIREGINLHDALERHGIKGLVLKAGDSKVPLTMLGSVTKSDLSKAQHTLNLMHDAFKKFVVQGRPALEGSIEDVADGDVYFGENALELSLIDRIVTSEEYLLERVQAGDRVMKLHRAHQHDTRRKLFHPLDFLREKRAPLRAILNKWMVSSTAMESMLGRAVAATSVLGAIQFLSQHKFFFGGDYKAR